MLGFSFSKILFTAVMIMAVWWVYRKINLLTGGEQQPKPKVKRKRSGAKKAPETGPQEVEDLAACPACGAYAAAGANPGCGRAAKDCPMQK